MKLRQGNMLTALESTRRFLDDHQAALVGVIAPATRQKLDGAIAELSVTATSQNQFSREVTGALAVQKATSTALLRDHLVPIAKIAKLELSNTPELVSLTLPQKRVTLQQLGALADGMAEAARPHAQVFIDAGRKPEFLDRLNHAANLMRTAVYDVAQARFRTRGSNTGLTEKLSRARKVVHMLDSFVKEAVGSDKAILDSWKVAKRVKKSTSNAHNTTPVGASTPAATTPATTTTAAAA